MKKFSNGRNKTGSAFSLKNIFEWASGFVAAAIIALFVLSFYPGEIGQTAYDLLTSNLILTLIGAVVAPWLAKTAKDKVGIEIEEKAIKDLLDGVAKAADLTRKEYDKERNPVGVMPEDKAKDAKAMAIANLRKVFGEKKYNDIVKKMGDQAIDKAIDAYVQSDWQKRYPIEKEQIKELTKIAIETIPKAKDWSKLSDDEKKELCKTGLAELKKLLAGVGIIGWGDQTLEYFVAAELNPEEIPTINNV